MRWILSLATLVILVTGCYLLLAREPLSTPSAPSAVLRLVQPNPELLASHYVFEISVHTREEVDAVLTRVDQLADSQPIRKDNPSIALVLHGPEIEFFSKKNYKKYKDIVNKAATLKARGVIEIKMCQTMMKVLGLNDKDVPPFIELVPFGPDEVERLEKKGYEQM